MGKAFVLIVAEGADLIPLLEHRHIIRAMQGVAVGTGFPVVVLMQALFLTGKGIGMTFSASCTDILWQ